jgi:hypothetical protein
MKDEIIKELEVLIEEVKKRPFEKYEKEYIQEGKIFCFRDLKGVEKLVDKTMSYVPDYADKKEIVLGITKQAIAQSNYMFPDDLDMSLHLMTLKMNQKWEIQQTIPNLKEMIREIVREELLLNKGHIKENMGKFYDCSTPNINYKE